MTETRNDLIWVGSELGYLKTIAADTGVVMNYGEAGELGRKNAPSSLLWRDSQEQELFVGKVSGTLQFFSCKSLTYSLPELVCGSSPIRGIGCFEGKVFACTEKGCFKCWNGNEIILEKCFGNDVRKLKQITLNQGIFATGGKENDLKVFDLNKFEKPIFAAKNVKNDSLDLRQPVWVNDICFLDNNESKIVVATGYHSIKIYDTKTQRRPISVVEWESYPITALSVAANSNDIIVGNTFGSMASMDIRNNRINGTYKGAAGSISSIDCHIQQDLVASVGLDRFLRIYNIKTRSLLQKHYLKSQLSSVLLSMKNYTGGLFASDMKEEKQKIQAKDHVDIGEQNDMLWNQMAVATDEVPIKKRKTNEKGSKKDKSKIQIK